MKTIDTSRIEKISQAKGEFRWCLLYEWVKTGVIKKREFLEIKKFIIEMEKSC
jgi:hypothetical protein